MPKRKHNSNFYRLVNEETCKTLELINISKKVEQDGVYESCGSLDCNNTQIVEHKNHDQQLDKCPTAIEMLFSYCEKMNLEINNDMQYEDQPQIEYKTMANVGPSFKSRLQCWAVEEQITHSALDKILQLLRTIPIKLDLPFSARTLLSTPRNIISKTIRPGSYVHLGVQHAVRTLLSDIFSKLPSNIELLINIDGLPLSKSSSSQFYPIMCSLYGHPETVALIGLYHGYEKPSVANEFLQDFVDDITELIQNGSEIGGKRVDVRVKGFICDAPAKSYVTYCKGHSGYFSCTKCLQKGTYLKGRICFPKTDFIKRTDASFLCKSQPYHHIGTSILEKIPYVGMVSSFPLEYMHLICLGVVKKLLVSIWMFGNPGNKLPAGNIKNISELYKSFKSCCPSEFCRKPRLIEEAKRWKATEFRFFLLYLGPVVLQSYISEEKYLNFLALHVAVRIFASDLHKTKVLFNYAKSLLHYFVQTFGNLYGYEYISHNVHGLLHVHEDVGNFGNLNFYSAFGFENYLQGLKKMVRKADKPLAQICNRIYELHQKRLEAIPITWLHTEPNKCYWPPFGGARLKNAIVKGEAPSPEWHIYNIRKIGGEYDDLIKARRKAVDAEFSSDVNSDVDGKRKIKKTSKVCSSTSDDSNESVVGYGQGPVVLPQLPISVQVPVAKSYFNLNNANTVFGDNNGSPLEPAPLINASSNADDAFRRQVLRQLSLINIKMDQIQQDLTSLIIKTAQMPPEPDRESVLVKFKLPLLSSEDLNFIEEFLANKDNSSRLVKELSLIGGVNYKAMVRRLLTKLLSNELAMGYSWIGFKQKANFSVLALARVVTDAVQLIHKNHTQAEIESEIKIILVKAKERRAKEKNNM